jgi:hypothetical protein
LRRCEAEGARTSDDLQGGSTGNRAHRESP